MLDEKLCKRRKVTDEDAQSKAWLVNNVSTKQTEYCMVYVRGLYYLLLGAVGSLGTMILIPKSDQERA